MLTVTFYTRENCSLCDQALSDLNDLKSEYSLQIVEIDVEKEGLAEYLEKIPVIEVGPYQLKAPFDSKRIAMTLSAARDRQQQLEKIGSEDHQEKVKRGSQITFGDRLFHWLSRRYMIIFNLFMFLYVGLAFLAPVLMFGGSPRPANLIYAVYGRLCHQLSYRSWFLYGEQAAYPRSIAGVDSLMTYEEATGFDPGDLAQAVKFRGNEHLGFKVAFCQRDIAIYGSILVFGIIFALTKRKIPGLPLYAWFILGILPIGLDGLSQIISQLPWPILPIRESTPLLRTLTGALFGFSTAWFAYPIVEDAMAETRKLLTIKMQAVDSRS